MRRLARWTLNVLTLLSLVICAAVLVGRVYSEARSATIGWRGNVREDFLSLSRGGLHYAVCFGVGRGNAFIQPHGWIGGTDPRSVEFKRIAQRDQWRFYWAGFGFDDKHRPGAGYAYDDALAPCWFVALAALPAIRIRRWRRRVAAARLCAGRCGRCSYDLTGNVSGVCPECGEAIAEPNGRCNEYRFPCDRLDRRAFQSKQKGIADNAGPGIFASLRTSARFPAESCLLCFWG